MPATRAPGRGDRHRVPDARQAFGQSGLVADKPPTATTCVGSEEVGDSKPVRNIVKRLRRHLGDDADNPTYIVNEPRVIFRMGKTEEPVQ